MAKFGWDERELFYVSNIDLENLSADPSDPDANQMAIYAKNDHIYIKKQSASAIPLVESASNLGTGVGVFDSKSTEDLQFRSIKSTSGHLDIALNGNDIELTVDLSDINDELDHGLLQGLDDDDHQYYLFISGRSGGQIVNGGTDAGDDLELRSTSNATKGSVQIIDGSDFEFGKRVFKEVSVQTDSGDVDEDAFTIALEEGKSYLIRALVVCQSTDEVQRGMWDQMQGCYRETAGSAALQGGQKSHFKTRTNGNLSVNFSASGNNVIVEVDQNALTETVDWRVQVEILRLS